MCPDLMSPPGADLYHNNAQLLFFVTLQGIVTQGSEACLCWFSLFCDLTLLVAIGMHVQHLCIDKAQRRAHPTMNDNYVFTVQAPSIQLPVQFQVANKSLSNKQ